MAISISISFHEMKPYSARAPGNESFLSLQRGKQSKVKGIDKIEIKDAPDAPTQPVTHTQIQSHTRIHLNIL